MANFVVIPTRGETEELESSISKLTGDKALRLPKGEWLVSYDGTSKQLSDELQISDNETLAAVVVSIGGYWGRADNNVWEWLAVNGG